MSRIGDVSQINDIPIGTRRGASLMLWCRALALGSLVLGTGCVGSHDWEFSYEGFEAHLVDRIEPGRTTFYEVLDLLGPPDSIIDGKQEISANTMTASMKVPTRVLTSPAGEVILLYSGMQAEGAMSGNMFDYQYSSADRPVELMVYVSKRSRLVTSVAGPPDASPSKGAATAGRGGP